MGNLVHSVENEDVCNMKCLSQCEVNDMKLIDFEFESDGVTCNSCTCTCR